MKLTIALLAVLVVCGSANLLRRNNRPQNNIEQQWKTEVPEIDQHKIQEKTYKDGAEYRYLYDGQILTGMPDIHRQFSGARIRAIVKIQTGAKELMQIEKVFVGSLHERFVSDPQTLIQLDAFEPMQEQDAPFEEVLKKPVRFTMENGKVDNFETTEDDPSWSINIKRSILSTFHLSLLDKEEPINPERREMIASSPSEESNQARPRSPKSSGSSNSEEKYFTVVEDGIAGRCEVSYVVLEQPDNMPESVYPIRENENDTATPRLRDTGVLNVTKTFNYRNCEYRPFIFRGLHFSSACPTCDSNPEDFFDALESAAHTRYNITGKRDTADWLIDSAITEAVYKVTPRSHLAGSMVSYANITVVLIQSGPKSAPINFPESNAIKIEGLHMIEPQFVRKDGDKIMFEAPEASRPIVQKKQYWPNMEEKPKKVKALFEKLVQGMEEKEVEAVTANNVYHITRILEQAFPEELIQIHEAIKSVSVAGVEKEEIEHLFVDLLVNTGHNTTFAYIKKLITEKKIQGPVVKEVLALLPLRMHPDKVNPIVMEEFRTLCMHESVSSDVFAKRACWLASATLVHKACVHRSFDARVQWKAYEEEKNASPESRSPRDRSAGRPTPRPTPRPSSAGGRDEQPESLRCPAEFRKATVEKLAQHMKTVDNNDEEKILAIRVIGNMGLEETIYLLEEIIEDETEPIYVRTQAIYALRAAASKVAKQEVLEILVPLYRESQNPTQIRIAAFLTIMTVQPELPVLQDIAQSLNREVDLDVASYVYSSLSSVANSTDPCLKNLTRDALLALEIAQPVNTEWRHSKNIRGGAYMSQLNSGLFWETNSIMDKDAPAPRAANFRLHATVNEKSLELVEFGMETEGWGESLRKYVGNFTEERIADILSGKAPRTPRAAESDPSLPVQNIDEIDRLLNIKPKEPKDVRGTAYVKIFGQETRFVVINPQTVSRFIVDLISQGDTVMPKLMSGEGIKMDQRRAGMLFDSKLGFPTVLGVPIALKFRVPVVAAVKGTVKVDMVPKPAGGLATLKQIPQQITVETDVETVIAASTQIELSVNLGFLKVGTGIRTRLTTSVPMDGKMELSLKDMMTKVTMDLPESPVKLVKMDSFPHTFVIRMSKNSQTYQAKPLPQGLEAQPTGSGAWSSSSSEEDEPRQPNQPNKSGSPRFLSLKMKEGSSLTINEHGIYRPPQSYNGLPIDNVEFWEIPTPDFVKDRKVSFKVGEEGLPVRFEVNATAEYPNTRLAPTFLPNLGAKCALEIKMIPKSGAKKIALTVYERSEWSSKSVQEMYAKLHDKVNGITIKELAKPLTPAQFETIPKIGHTLQFLVSENDAPESWTTRGLVGVITTVDGSYIAFAAAMESKVPALPKKVSFKADIRYPERTGMWFPTPQEALNKSIQGQAELFWGDDLTAEKQIKLRLRYQKTENQIKIEKGDLYDVNGIPIPFEVATQVREGDALFSSLYKSCEDDRKIGAFFSKECVDLAVRYADLLRMKFDIEYKNVSPAVRKVLHKVEWMVGGIYHTNVDVEDVDVKNPENKISAVVEYSADRSYVDIKYKTPTKNVKIMNIDLPYNVQPVNALFPWSPSRLVGLATPVSCSITGPKINTFDDVSDWMPLSGCYHVMAKDAADDNLFAVLVSSVAKNSQLKKVVVMFENNRVEFVPKPNAALMTGIPTDSIDVKSLYIVKLNGQELKDVLTPGKRTTIPQNQPEDKQPLAEIVLASPEMVGNKSPIIYLVSQATGIKVAFDGASVTVMPSPFWKNNLVGLCGPYNGQSWDDKLLPNKTMVEEPVALSRAFLLNANGCDKEIAPIPTPEKRTRQ